MEKIVNRIKTEGISEEQVLEDHGVRTKNLYFWLGNKTRGSNRYVYYSCSRARDKNCKNKYIREEDLINQIISFLDDIDINELGMKKHLEDEVKRFNKFQKSVFGVNEKLVTDHDMDMRNYAKYLLREGSKTEKRELLSNLKSRIIYEDKELSLV
jgi:hypothetical protein